MVIATALPTVAVYALTSALEPGLHFRRIRSVRILQGHTAQVQSTEVRVGVVRRPLDIVLRPAIVGNGDGEVPTTVVGESCSHPSWL